MDEWEDSYIFLLMFYKYFWVLIESQQINPELCLLKHMWQNILFSYLS